MKRLFTLPAILLSLVLMTSCNLFIEDDEVNEAGFKNVPTHTGDGYDAPMTTEQEGLKVTYQYKKDVRVLSADDADRYVTKVLYDAVGAFIEIHFSSDAPREVLPVSGEVLMTTVSDRFKWGCCHRIQYRVDDEAGVYKYIGTFVPVKEAFDDLQIDGQLAFEEEKEFYVEPDDPVAADEEEPAADDDEARSRRKLEQTILPHVKVILDDDGFGFELATPWTIETNQGNHYRKIDCPAETNTYRIQDQLNFDEWNFSEGDLKFHFRQTVEETNEVKISGGYHLAKKKIFSVSPMTQAIPVGPLVIVIFVDIDLNLTVDIDVTTTLTKHKKAVYDYDVDIFAMTITKSTNIIDDTGWKWSDFQGACVVTLELAITVGLGIYGKVISVKIIPAYAATLTVATPKTLTDSRGNVLADLTERPGPEVEYGLTIKLGAFLDLSLRDLVGGVKEVGTAEQKKLLADLEADAKQQSEYYKDIVETDKAKGSDDIGLYTTFGPFFDGKVELGTWYPKLNDKSLKVTRLWDATSQMMTFVGEYSITAKGILAKMFGKKYVPALCLERHNKVVDYFFSEEAGYSNEVSTTKAYHFYLPTLDDDKTYTISPCYFVKGKLSAPVAIDKALSYNATSPHTAITMVKPTAVKRVTNTNRFAGDPKYTFTFKFDTYTDVKGMANIESWGVSDQFSGISHPYAKKTDKKQKDGTYLMHWVVTMKTDSESTGIAMGLRPYYKVEGTNMTGETVAFMMNSDHKYSVTLDGNTKEGNF